MIELSQSLQGAPAVDGRACPECGRAARASQAMCAFCYTRLPVLYGAVDGPASASAAARRWARWIRSRHARLLAVALIVAAALFVNGRLTAPPRPLAGASDRAVPAAGASWAIVDGGLDAARATAAAAALDGEVAWRVALGSRVVTPIVAGPDAIYVGVVDGALLALSTRDGHVLWGIAVPGQIDLPPTLAGDRLFVMLRSGAIVALSTADGSELWSVPIDVLATSIPLVADGIVYLVSPSQVLALDAEDGRQLWRRPLVRGWQPTPPVISGRWLVLSTASAVIVLDRFSGEQTFFYTQSNITRLTIADQQVFAVTPRAVLAVRADERRPWWDGIRGLWAQLIFWQMAPAMPQQPREWIVEAPRGSLSPAVAGDLLVLANSGGEVRALDLGSGRERWRLAGAPLVVAPIAAANGVLLVERGALVLLDRDTGAERQRRAVDAEAITGVAVTAGGTYLKSGLDGVLALR